MPSGKIARRAVLIGAVVAAFQAASFAGVGPTIYFTDADNGAPAGLPQVTDGGSGTGPNAATFTPPTGPNSATDIANSILTVTGSYGVYVPGYATGINDNSGNASNYVSIGGFNPPDDNVYVALKIDNDGTYVNPNTLSGQSVIAKIDADINAGYPGLASPVSGAFTNVFNGYDILLSFPNASFDGSSVTAGTGSNGQFDVGYDFFEFTDTAADSTPISNVTVTSFAVVPEPASLGVLAAASLVLLPRYRRRRA